MTDKKKLKDPEQDRAEMDKILKDYLDDKDISEEKLKKSREKGLHATKPVHITGRR